MARTRNCCGWPSSPRQRREGRHITPFVRPTTNDLKMYLYFVRPHFFFVRFCLNSIFNYFTIFYSNYEPRHVIHNVLVFYFRRTFYEGTYNRDKTIHGNFYFIIPQSNRNQLLCSQLKK